MAARALAVATALGRRRGLACRAAAALLGVGHRNSPYALMEKWMEGLAVRTLRAAMAVAAAFGLLLTGQIALQTVLGLVGSHGVFSLLG